MDMKKYYALFNPLSCNHRGFDEAKRLDAIYGEENVIYCDVTKIKDFRDFFAEIPLDCEVVLCGGDGTLNCFINAVRGLAIEHTMLYYPCGSGNDFWHDIGGGDRPRSLNEYLRELPSVTVNGEEHFFINGVGYGLDGYCCEVGDQTRRENPKKKIDYTGIAIKGCLFHYHPTTAYVTVDGREYEFKRTWVAPTMFGRFYGGGMMAVPVQDRHAEEKTVSVMIFHGTSRLRTLMIFPSIFKGEHIKHTKYVTLLTGKEISVRFDQPRAIQIDGETHLGITEYTARVHSAVPACKE